MGGGSSKQRFQDSLKYLLEHKPRSASTVYSYDHVLEETEQEITISSSVLAEEEEKFWKVLWTYPGTTSIKRDDEQHVFSLLQEQYVLQLFYENPDNLHLLLRNAVVQLVSCSRSNEEKERNVMIINCCRILSRILPILYSIRTEIAEKFVDKVFWSPPSTPEHATQFHQGEYLEVVPLGKKRKGEQSEDTLALGIALMEALNQLLFLPNFTIYSTVAQPVKNGARSDGTNEVNHDDNAHVLHTPLYIDDFNPELIWYLFLLSTLPLVFLVSQHSANNTPHSFDLTGRLEIGRQGLKQRRIYKKTEMGTI